MRARPFSIRRLAEEEGRGFVLVVRTEVRGVTVSTLSVPPWGRSHRYETALLWGGGIEVVARYRIREEAKSGHELWVEAVRQVGVEKALPSKL